MREGSIINSNGGRLKSGKPKSAVKVLLNQS